MTSELMVMEPLGNHPINGTRIIVAHKLAEDEREYEIDTAACWLQDDDSLLWTSELSFDIYPEYWCRLPVVPS